MPEETGEQCHFDAVLICTQMGNCGCKKVNGLPQCIPCGNI